MRAAIVMGLCVLIIVGAGNGARADVLPFFRKPGPPKPPPPPPAFPAEPFTIEVLGENEGVQPVLQITPNFYKALRKLALDDAQPTDRQITEAAGPEAPRLRLVIAGLALALAISAGGLWLRRSGGARVMKLAVLLGVTAILGSAAIMATPPLKPKPEPEMKAQLPPLPIENRLRVELIDQKSDAVHLRVSRGYLERLVEANKPKPKEKDAGPVLPPPPTDFPRP
jgi:hypothetical protein